MANDSCPGERRMVKKQVVMLKRKFSELSGRLDRLHGQVSPSLQD
jgi:hypothetical protein